MLEEHTFGFDWTRKEISKVKNESDLLNKMKDGKKKIVLSRIM